MLQFDPAVVAAVIGSALAVVSILLTMIWTIRAMYAHESRLAGVSMIEAVADWSCAGTNAERRAAMARAKEWLRVCDWSMDHARRRSGSALFLMVTALLLAVALAVVALSDSYTLWQETALGLCAAAGLHFTLAAIAVYQTLGGLRYRPVLAATSFAVTVLSVPLPFFSGPEPRRWPEVNELVQSIEELRRYDEAGRSAHLAIQDLIVARRPAASFLTRLLRAFLKLVT